MTIKLIFLLAALGLAYGAQFKKGDTRVVMMMPKTDDCRMDDECTQSLNFDTNQVLTTKAYEDMGASDMSTSSVTDQTSFDGNLRGRKLCNAACVEQYGLYICILFGWCRRRELAAEVFAPATIEDPVLNDLHDECWVYRGVEMDAAFTSLMPSAVSGYSTAGVSYRTQIYICGEDGDSQ